MAALRNRMIKFLDRLFHRAPGEDTVPLSVGFHADGLSLSVGGGPPQRLLPVTGVDQTRPRDLYVYAHVDASGSIFYVGRGTGRRAWSKDRETTWVYYVTHHLQGVYTVQILADGLSVEDAEELESRWIAQENDGLVNLQNMARGLDREACDRRDALMRQHKQIFELARSLESTDLSGAIHGYTQALALLKEFSVISFEKGLYGKLFAEQQAINGPFGQITLLDRLTLCLIKAGRPAEAQSMATDYFSVFKKDRNLTVAKAIEKRLAKHAAR